MERTKMPNKDGTGPEGKGPKTGRQNGKCEGKSFYCSHRSQKTQRCRRIQNE